MKQRVWGQGSMMLVGLVALSILVRCAAGQASNQTAAGNSNANPADPLQALEESDIYKRDGDRLFILNRFRGLILADLTNLDAPRITGRLPLPAQPREMWVTGNTALIITSQATAWGYGWWWGGSTSNVDVNTFANYAGSALAAADVANPALPQLASLTRLGGDCYDGRLRGSILYLACAANSGTLFGDGYSHIYALDISDPLRPRQLSDLTLPAFGSEHHLAVGENAIYVAAVNAVGVSTVTYVDISRADGVITQRASVQVQGEVLDRFSMDEFQGVLRVASGAVHAAGNVYLTTFSVTNPDSMTQLGRHTLPVGERLTSARFDGPNGYVVTFKQVDPLFVFDLSDPTNPHRTGDLHMSGWLDFMVPMGDRLLAMGHEDVPLGTTWWGSRRVRRTLAVSLMDVGAGHPPELLSRVPLDGKWGEIPAERDDYNKLLRVFKDEGLILFPYRTFHSSGFTRSAGMLLLDWKDDRLSLKKDVKDIGLVERGILWTPTTLVTLSVQVLQVLDITHRDSPVVRAQLDLARQVSYFAALQDGVTAVDLAGDFETGPASLVAHGMDDAPGTPPLSTVTLDAPSGFLFSNGNLVYVVGAHKPTAPLYTVKGEEDEPMEPTSITVVDYTNPASPQVMSSMSLGEEVTYGSVSGYYGVTGGQMSSQVVQASPGVLVLYQRPVPHYGRGCSHFQDPGNLWVVDLRNPRQPRLGDKVTLQDTEYPETMSGSGGKVLLMEYNGVRVLDVGDPGHASLTELITTHKPTKSKSPFSSWEGGWNATGARVLALAQDESLVFGQDGAGLVMWSIEDGQLKELARIGSTSTDYYGGSSVANARTFVFGNASAGHGYQVFSYQDHSLTALGTVAPGLSTTNSLEGPTLPALVSVQADSLVLRDQDKVILFTLGNTGPQAVTRGRVDAQGTTRHALVRNNTLYLAGGYQGFVRHPVSP